MKYYSFYRAFENTSRNAVAFSYDFPDKSVFSTACLAYQSFCNPDFKLSSKCQNDMILVLRE